MRRQCRDGDIQRCETGTLLGGDGKALAPEVLAGGDAVGGHVGHGAQDVCRDQRRSNPAEHGVDIIAAGGDEFSFHALAYRPARGLVRAAQSGKRPAMFGRRASDTFERHLRDIENGKMLGLGPQQIRGRNAGFDRVGANEVRSSDRRSGRVHQSPDDAAFAPVRSGQKADTHNDNFLLHGGSQRSVTVDVTARRLVSFEDQVRIVTTETKIADGGAPGRVRFPVPVPRFGQWAEARIGERLVQCAVQRGRGERFRFQSRRELKKTRKAGDRDQVTGIGLQ